MRVLRIGSAAVWLALGLLSMEPAAVVLPTQRAEEWRGDLDDLVDRLPSKHLNLFHSITPDRFDQEARKLRAQIPTLADDQILAGFARLFALVGDGHTNLYLLQPETGFRIYPIRLYLFDEGLYVHSAVASYAGAVGARVLKVGEQDAQAALEAVRPLISGDNEMSQKMFAPIYLTSPDILHAVGLVADPGEGGYLLEQPGHAPFILRPEPVPVGTAMQFVTPRQRNHLPKLLSARHPDVSYWFESLDDSRVLYLQYNRARNSKEERFSHFCRRFFRVLDAHPVEKVVLDLRWNGGGNESLNRPLVQGLARRPVGRKKGRLLVLIGRGTFSAAASCALDLERATRAVFIGEPVRSKPDQYGESNVDRLPRSGIRFSYSSIYWQHDGAKKKGSRPWLAPDVAVPVSITDYRAGRDAALEAALSYPWRKEAGAGVGPYGLGREEPAQAVQEGIDLREAETVMRDGAQGARALHAHPDAGAGLQAPG